MSELSSWKSLTVREFLEAHNWIGLALLRNIALDSHPYANGMTTVQRQTIQPFFRQSNWTRHPVAQQEFVTSHEFSTRLAVNDFCRCFV